MTKLVGYKDIFAQDQHLGFWEKLQTSLHREGEVKGRALLAAILSLSVTCRRRGENKFPLLVLCLRSRWCAINRLYIMEVRKQHRARDTQCTHNQSALSACSPSLSSPSAPRFIASIIREAESFELFRSRSFRTQSRVSLFAAGLCLRHERTSRALILIGSLDNSSSAH